MTDFVFCTDLHLRSTVPSCRKETVEEYVDYQISKLEEMFFYCNENGINNIICGGDFFDRWKSENSNYLMYKLIELFNYFDYINFWTICGNHDMPYHNEEYVSKSLFGVLDNACKNFIPVTCGFSIKDCIFHPFDYGTEVEDIDKTARDCVDIAVVHTNIFEKSIPTYMDGDTAKEFSDRYNYDMILAGHLHQNYIFKNNEKVLVNGGCLTRQNISQKRFRPCFWHITCDSADSFAKPKKPMYMDVKPVYFTTNRDEIVDNTQKSDIGTFVEVTEDLSKIETFDFREDVMNEMQKGEYNDSVKDIVEECLDEV